MTIRQDGFIFREPSEKSRAVVQRDLGAISPSYTRSYGFVMSHGKGAEAWDVDGNRYIDFAAGIAVLATGHSHPRIVETIKAQADRYIHIGATDFFCPEPVNLAEKLQEIIPIHGAHKPLDKMIYFGNSGTEAVESALKLARYRDDRLTVVAFYGGFHGRTMGALSLTASKAIQRAGYPYIPGGVVHVPYPARFDQARGEGWGDPVKFIEKIIFKHKVPPQEVAAIIVEPIQGEGGYLLPTDDFLSGLRDLCDKYGILLIFDEIQSGIGRTGKWCAAEHWGVEADIVCLAKGLASGVPIGAIVAHKDIMKAWVPGAHASTFGGNPLACAVASATIEVIEDEGLLDHVTRIGKHVLDRLTLFQKNRPSIRRVEGKGFMIGIDFADANDDAIPAFRDRVVEESFIRGLLTLGCGSSGVRFAPPLVITKELVDEGLDILEHAIATLEEELWDRLV